MTYLVYALWFAVLLLLAGEVDRLFGGRLLAWVPFDVTAPRRWFVPPLQTMAVPGFGQLLNQQPAKALLAFLWPICVAGFSRPWQLDRLPLVWLLMPWYLIIVTDALAVAAAAAGARRRGRGPQPARESAAARQSRPSRA